MKIAVFSDIHGNYQALKAILNDIERNNINQIIFLGDAIALGPDSFNCLKLLYSKKITFILGNHEYFCLRNNSTLNLEPKEFNHHCWVKKNVKNILIDNNLLKYDKIINDKKYSFIHFFQCDEDYPFKSLDIFDSNLYLEMFKNYDADYIFYGHLHEGRYDEIDNKHFYGVGSSGCTINNKTFYYIIDTSKNKIYKRKINYNRRKFKNRITNLDFPEKEEICSKFYNINIS